MAKRGNSTVYEIVNRKIYEMVNSNNGIKEKNILLNLKVEALTDET